MFFLLEVAFTLLCFSPIAVLRTLPDRSPFPARRALLVCVLGVVVLAATPGMIVLQRHFHPDHLPARALFHACGIGLLGLCSGVLSIAMTIRAWRFDRTMRALDDSVAGIEAKHGITRDED